MRQLVTSSISRRSALRLGSAFVAMPFLETFAGSGNKQLEIPKRMVFMGGGYGFTVESFYPKKVGRFADIGLTLGLRPLQEHINDITMVGNLNNPSISDPHAGTAGYLSGNKTKISCDQLASQYIGNLSRFPSLVVTTPEGRGGHGTGGLSLSNGPEGKPIGGLKRPIDLYHKLFSGGGASKEEMNDRLAKKGSVLDIFAANGRDMTKRLSNHDKNKVEEYFQSIREVELGLQRQAQWADVPKPKAPFDEPSQILNGEQEVKLVMDMIIIALQTDSTRIATYRLPINSLLSSLEIGISSHAMSHYKFSATKRLDSEKRDRKLMELYGYFINRLKNTNDREGHSLYETTIASYGSNLRTGHTLRDCPALLSGGTALGLKHGKHMRLRDLTNLSNYWLTILQAAGIEINQFNDSNGTVPELLS